MRGGRKRKGEQRGGGRQERKSIYTGCRVSKETVRPSSAPSSPRFHLVEVVAAVAAPAPPPDARPQHSVRGHWRAQLPRVSKRNSSMKTISRNEIAKRSGLGFALGLCQFPQLRDCRVSSPPHGGGLPPKISSEPGLQSREALRSGAGTQSEITARRQQVALTKRD